jgi:hypothetical protein
LGVFGPARSTNAFLSIGTGIPSNQEITDPTKTAFRDTMQNFVGAATNSQITHVLFRTLLDAFAPKPMGKKYWRLNIGTFIGDWDQHKGIWPFNETIHHMDDYEKIGELDDVSALPKLYDVTDKYIQENQGMIDECTNALKESL